MSPRFGLFGFGRAGRAVATVSHYEPENLKKLETLSRVVPVSWSPNITVGVNYLLRASRSKPFVSSTSRSAVKPSGTVPCLRSGS